MLIISRKSQQSFFIGDDIEVIILDASNDKVSIGINAPKDIQILRKELIDTLKFNKESAIDIDKVDLKEINNKLIGK